MCAVETDPMLILFPNKASTCLCRYQTLVYVRSHVNPPSVTRCHGQSAESYILLLALLLLLLLLLPLALQPTVGFGLSNNVLPFFPICHQLSPSSHSQHLKISFYFLFPSFPGSSPSSHPFQFLSEDVFGHPIHLQQNPTSATKTAMPTFLQNHEFTAAGTRHSDTIL